MRIYLDNCCLNRPFDDQSNPRVHLEAEAVKTIFSLCEEGKWALVGSEVLDFEINNAPNRQKAHILELMAKVAVKNILLSEAMHAKAVPYELAGVQTFDALHLAIANEHADVLLTTDDKFLKRAQQIAGLNIRVMNPLDWLQEVLP